MSEYQFYEFAAVDGPISDEGLNCARACSTRAEVSPFRWRNVYNFGDFHGSVERLLQYYDAHVYLANWRSFRFALSFPEGSLDSGQIEPYLCDNGDYGLTVRLESGRGRAVIWWELYEDGGWDSYVDGTGILDRLLGIREELMRGDFRALCIGWLASFGPDEWDDPRDAGTHLPPLVPGLDQLSSALRELVKWTGADPDVLQAAAELCSGDMPGRIPIGQVLDKMPSTDMRGLLSRVAEGDGSRVMSELNRMTYPPMEASALGSPTCAELAASALKVRDARLRREAKERAARRRQEEEAKKRHLASVMKRADTVWSLVPRMMEKRIASSYDAVASQLTELRDAYRQADRESEFQEKLAVFREEYGRRSAMMRRIKDL